MVCRSSVVGFVLAPLVVAACARSGPRDACVMPPVTTATATANANPDDVRAANAFAAKLYVRARKATGNVLVSGASLRQALAIPYLGARGDTARAMATALELAPEASAAAAAAKAENAAWQEAKGQSDLSVASRLYVEKSSALLPEFTAATSDAFGAAAEPVDFAHAPEDARKTINTWVSEKTAEKIPELLPKGAVDARSQLVVANAIFFKARWSLPFEASATKDEPFHVDAKTTKPVATMHATDQHAYAETGGVKLVALTYRASEMSMLFVLPDDASDKGLAKVEESLTEDVLRAWTAALGQRRVTLSLPRFAFRSGAPMTPILADLGMKQALADGADFSGITEKKGVTISQVFQQTWVSVDEQGTEAAAATGVVMRPTSLVLGPIAEIKLDRPFLFLVRDSKRGRILFVGRVADPTSKGT